MTEQRGAAAALLLLSSPAPGHAQTTDQLLLSNTSTSFSGGGFHAQTGGPHAQPFTTGKNATGYTLTRVHIRGRDVSTNLDPLPLSTITVTLRGESSGDPADSDLATFLKPDTWDRDGLNEFRLTTPANLDSEETYYIVISASQRTIVGRGALPIK